MSLQGRFMAVNFASDMQAELEYFAGAGGIGVDGVYTDCTRTTSEWLQLMCVAVSTRLLHHLCSGDTTSINVDLPPTTCTAS